jgi:hypothetical protein
MTCEHCGEFLKHAPWCIVENVQTFYAYSIVANPRVMIEQDLAFLKKMHIDWNAEACQ